MPIKEAAYAESYRVKDQHGKKYFLKLINAAKLHHSQFDADKEILEVKIAKQLNHQNVVGFHDAGEVVLNEKKYSYIVFDFIAGETVAEKVAREQECSVYEAKRIAIGVLKGVKSLHENKDPILHNELTIQNVMLDLAYDPPTPVIIDMGHARYFSQSSKRILLQGMNPFYTPPEAINGVCSVQSDIFSVGVMLYQLIFDSLPFFVDLSRCKNQDEKETMLDEARRNVLNIPTTDIYELDEQLINTLHKSLAYDPDDRFQSAEEFIKALNGEIKVENPNKYMKYKSGDNETKKVRKSIAKGEGFSAIAGMQELKDLMQTEVIDALNHSEEYARYGLTIPNGMLLYGPPGCGKTFFAKHFAEEVGFNYMEVKPSTLKSRFVNATQENIGKMFEDARKDAPTIIFIDEMNELVPNRDSNDVHEMSRSAVNEMLAQMDRTGEDGIFIIGATNYPNMIDPAILRAGRLDKKFYIGPPDKAAREAMLQMYLINRPYDFGIDYTHLAQMTEGYVSADLKVIVDDASRMALLSHSKITQQILEDVIKKTRPSLSPSELQKYQKIKNRLEDTPEPEKGRRKIGF